MTKKEYDLIYSIGASCACAGYMKRHDMRFCSGPFDWLSNASLATNLDLIANNFKDFIDPQNLTFYAKNDRALNNCDTYKNTKTGTCFVHDFISDIPFEEIFPSIKEKYERRIQRFYKKIEEADSVLLIWLNCFSKSDENNIVEKCNEIMKKFNKKIDFLIIEHDETKPRGEIEHKSLSENVEYYLLHIKKEDKQGNLTTMGDVKNVNRIFSKYRLKMPITKRSYLFIKRYSIKILCALAPSKELRRKLKKDL